MKPLLCVLGLLLLTAATVVAQTYTFIATGPAAPGLSPLNENPPHPSSSGIGTAMVTWDVATNMMTVHVVFSGLSGNTTASHIHCCVAPGGNAGVATTVPTFTGFPLGVTSGTYSHSFNMTQATSYNPAFVTAHGGTVASAEAALLAGILAGQAYLNVHTTTFPGGEIRGFLVVPVDIAIKPGASAPVPINPDSKGNIPVAILSTTSFNAVTSIDAASLTFGRTGSEQSLLFCAKEGEDVNGDGLPDLVCHFQSQTANFQAGDTAGILKGKTVQGSPILGQEAITTVP